jgi:hypothetical protein
VWRALCTQVYDDLTPKGSRFQWRRCGWQSRPGIIVPKSESEHEPKAHGLPSDRDAVLAEVARLQEENSRALRERAERLELERKKNELPLALTAAPRWSGVGPKDGDGGTFVARFAAVIRLLRAEEVPLKIAGTGVMRNVARLMFDAVDRGGAWEAEVAELLHRVIPDHDACVHEAADHFEYFRDGIGSPAVSLWGDLAQSAGLTRLGYAFVRHPPPPEVTPSPIVAAPPPVTPAYNDYVREAFDEASKAIQSVKGAFQEFVGATVSAIEQIQKDDSDDLRSNRVRHDLENGWLVVGDTAVGTAAKLPEHTAAATVLRVILERATEGPTKVMDLASTVDRDLALAGLPPPVDDGDSKDEHDDDDDRPRRRNGLGHEERRSTTFDSRPKTRLVAPYEKRDAKDVYELWRSLLRQALRGPKARTWLERWLHWSAKDRIVHVRPDRHE